MSSHLPHLSNNIYLPLSGTSLDLAPLLSSGSPETALPSVRTIFEQVDSPRSSSPFDGQHHPAIDGIQPQAASTYRSLSMVPIYSLASPVSANSTGSTVTMSKSATPYDYGSPNFRAPVSAVSGDLRAFFYPDEDQECPPGPDLLQSSRSPEPSLNGYYQHPYATHHPYHQPPYPVSAAKGPVGASHAQACNDVHPPIPPVPAVHHVAEAAQAAPRRSTRCVNPPKAPSKRVPKARATGSHPYKPSQKLPSEESNPSVGGPKIKKPSRAVQAESKEARVPIPNLEERAWSGKTRTRKSWTEVEKDKLHAAVKVVKDEHNINLIKDGKPQQFVNLGWQLVFAELAKDPTFTRGYYGTLAVAQKDYHRPSTREIAAKKQSKALLDQNQSTMRLEE